MVANHARKNAARARQAAEGGSHTEAVRAVAAEVLTVPETRTCNVCGEVEVLAAAVPADAYEVVCPDCHRRACQGCGVGLTGRHHGYCPYSDTYDGGTHRVEWDHTEHNPYEAAEFNRDWDAEVGDYAEAVVGALAEAGFAATAVVGDEGFELTITTQTGVAMGVDWDYARGWHQFDEAERVVRGLPVDSLDALIPTVPTAAERIAALAAGTTWPPQTPADRPYGLEAGDDNDRWYEALAHLKSIC